MNDAFGFAIILKGTAELRAAIRSASKRYTENPRDLVQNIGDCFGVLFPQQIYPEIARESIRGDVCFSCYMKQVNRNLFHWKAGHRRDEGLYWFAWLETLTGLAVVDD